MVELVIKPLLHSARQSFITMDSHTVLISTVVPCLDIIIPCILSGNFVQKLFDNGNCELARELYFMWCGSWKISVKF